MGKTKQNRSKNSHSLWNSHANRKKWLAESLAEMEQDVEQMSKLIEEDGDSSANHSELIVHVEKFRQMYRTLADHNEQGGFRKKIKSELKSLAGGFDLFGGISDHSKKNGDDGSSSSSSDSNSDVDDMSNANFGVDSSLLHQRILELENELSELKEKLKIQEDTSQMESANLDIEFKVTELEKQLLVANNKLYDSEVQISDFQKKLEESTAALEAMNAELSSEKEKVYRLDEQIALSQDEISSLLQENTSFETRIADLEDLNAVLNAEVDKYSKDTASLEAQILDLERVVLDLKASSSSSMEKLLQEKSTLEAEVMTLTGQIRQLEDDRLLATEEHVKCINELNQSMDALKLNNDTITSEKLELAAKLNALTDELKRRDDRIDEMDQHLNQLQLEHVKMTTAMEESSRLNSELHVRVKELEEEVEKQKAAVSDGAEGKREAIRQLCFSLDHYRNQYNELRQLLQGHKRYPIMAS